MTQWFFPISFFAMRGCKRWHDVKETCETHSFPESISTTKEQRHQAYNHKSQTVNYRAIKEHRLWSWAKLVLVIEKETLN